MNISQALCAAADHIERHPDSYNFNLAIVSDEKMGCMLGHFGRIAGLQAGLSVDTVALAVLDTRASDFYEDICAAAGRSGSPESVINARIVPDAMREVAKKYEGIPQDVREIFAAKAKIIPYPILSGDFYFTLAAQAYRRDQARRLVEELQT